MRRIIVVTALFMVAYHAGAVHAQSRKFAAGIMQHGLLESKTMTETRPTLDPRIFTGYYSAQSTYAIAKQIPNVLDKLFCYCYCAVNPKFKHKSLLTCYTDGHASKCGICMKEALVAKQMTDKGAAPSEIAMSLKKTYLR